MASTRFGRAAVWLAVLALIAAVVVTAPATLAGDRFVVRVPEPFEINGEIYPAGKLSLEPVRALSPVATLHEFRVDGESQGMLLVRSDDAGTVASISEIGFLRSPDGHLVLESVAIAGRTLGMVYSYRADVGQWFASSPAPREVEVASKD